MPYLRDRPQSLNRFPNVIHGISFYQKDVTENSPDWAVTYSYKTSDKKNKEYIVGDDIATLLLIISLGCIEINPWFSRIKSPDYPDYSIIDLDPDKQILIKLLK